MKQIKKYRIIKNNKPDKWQEREYFYTNETELKVIENTLKQGIIKENEADKIEIDFVIIKNK
jgi:hypothetical protein